MSTTYFILDPSCKYPLPPNNTDQTILTDSPTLMLPPTQFLPLSGASAISMALHHPSAILSFLHHPSFPFKLDLSALVIAHHHAIAAWVRRFWMVGYLGSKTVTLTSQYVHDHPLLALPYLTTMSHSAHAFLIPPSSYSPLFFFLLTATLKHRIRNSK